MSDAARKRCPDGEQDVLVDRIATAADRQLPDFVIIGAQRGGTTSLYQALGRHKQIEAALRKEVHYFDRYYERGLDWYLAHFPLRQKGRLTGEASPSYLFDPLVPERLRAALPAARFIVLLRNPIDRAYSHYHLAVRRGLEPLAWEEALAREPERLASGGGDRTSLPWRHFSYVERGVYADQLARWFATFPRERFHIIQSERFDREPSAVLAETQRFLGLAVQIPADLRRRHQAEYAPMNAATRARLAARFAPDNQRLYALLDVDFGWERD